MFYNIFLYCLKMNNRYLLSASEEGNIEVVRALLADPITTEETVNAQNEDGYTPLMNASAGGHLEVVRALLVDPRTTEETVNAQSEDGYTALTLSMVGHYEVFDALLNDPRTDVNLITDDDNETFLMAASRLNDEYLIRALLADPRTTEETVNVINNGLDTALIIASQEGHLEAVRALLADPRTDVNVRDGNGYNALMFASGVRDGHIEIVRALRADPRLRDDDSEVDDSVFGGDSESDFEGTGEDALSDVADDYRKDVFEFEPSTTGDGDDAGKNYLYKFKAVYVEARDNYSPFTQGVELPFEFKIKGQIGVDYSGVFRQVTSDFIDYWLPTHSVKFASSDAEPLYTFRFPRLSAIDKGDVRTLTSFGNVLGFLAELVRLSPKIHNTPLNLALDVVLDEILMGSSVYDEDLFSRRPPLHRFYDNLTCGDEAKLADRFSSDVLVKSGNWKNYSFVETFGNIITSGCNQFDGGLNNLLNDFVAGDPTKPRDMKALLALTLYAKACPYIFDEDDLKNIDGLDTPVPEDIEKRIGEILDSSFNLTEQEYLDLWVRFYTRFLTSDESVQTFARGLRTAARTQPPRALLTASLRGDGLDDSNIREAILAKLVFDLGTVEQKRAGTEAFAAYLEASDYIEVRRLLKFWTASTQIKPSVVLHVNPISSSVSLDNIRRGLGPLPVAHTCFNTLDVEENLIFVPGLVEQFKRKLGQATSVTEISLA